MGIRRRYLDLSWGQAHVVENLGAGPLILALHKVTSASSFYRPLIAPLADRGYSVAALDLAGYGMSDPAPADEPSLSWYADSCAEVVQALGFGAAWLLGNKTGASVAMRTAVDHPGLVSGLLLWSVPYLYPDLEHALATEEVPRYGPDGEEIAVHWRRVYGACSPERAELIATRELGERLLATSHQPAAHRALARDDHGALLAAITQRTAIFANRDDNLLSETRRAARAMPAATYTEFDYPLGYLADEYPRELAAFLDEFIRG
jgi:pimeloyl-ACP methyl ester carboxylesterase